MLTRLKVQGFKNLVDVDLRFSPFTCIAGANGIGKSNLFDAITFLSALASKPLMEAAMSIRNEEGRSADLRALFHRVGDSSEPEMYFEAEMIAPTSAVDEFGQTAKATITFLRYGVRLGLRKDTQAWSSMGALEILEEKLVHITRGESRANLLFPHSDSWQNCVVVGVRRAPAFISTVEVSAQRRVLLHQDGGSSGKALSKPAAQLPRTMLSSANAAENPTVLCAKREMESWVRMQLEPSALRAPDDLHAVSHLGTRGEHLPATLYRLANMNGRTNCHGVGLYSQLTNRLISLIDDVRGVEVERDDKRETLTVQIRGRNGTIYPARSLSDGTLRFLALAVLEQDPTAQAVICLEEPENGIHPERIPTMLQLLQDIATDPNEPVDETNPLRQVIVNTHSPAVVMQVPPESLVFADSREAQNSAGKFQKTVFNGLNRTWRTKSPANETPLAIGNLLAYINPVIEDEEAKQFRRRVIDMDSVQMLLPI